MDPAISNILLLLKVLCDVYSYVHCVAYRHRPIACYKLNSSMVVHSPHSWLEEEGKTQNSTDIEIINWISELKLHSFAFLVTFTQRSCHDQLLSWYVCLQASIDQPLCTRGPNHTHSSSFVIGWSLGKNIIIPVSSLLVCVCHQKWYEQHCSS